MPMISLPHRKKTGIEPRFAFWRSLCDAATFSGFWLVSVDRQIDNMSLSGSNQRTGLNKIE